MPYEIFPQSWGLRKMRLRENGTANPETKDTLVLSIKSCLKTLKTEKCADARGAR